MKKFSFVKNQKIFFGIAIAVLILGIISFFTLNFNFDIDFVGGTEISYDMGQAITPEDEADITNMVEGIIGAENFSSLRLSGDKTIVTIRTLVMDNTDTTDEVSAAIDASIASLYPDASLTPSSSDTDKTFTFAADEADEEAEAKEWTDDDVAAVEAALSEIEADDLAVSASGSSLYVTFNSSSIVAKYRADITEAITGKYENAKWRSTDTVSAEVSEGLKRTAIIATALAVLLMLIYIAFRFQVSSALAAIVCLVHDIFVVIVAYSVFQLPVNSNIIAVLLTILGYSINATIIIFDRIRENEKKMGGVPFADKVDEGIRSTLMRSVNTTVTTLLTIGMIYILGVTSIKNFSLPLIVGIIAGLFSSVCLAGPLWNLFRGIGPKKKSRR